MQWLEKYGTWACYAITAVGVLAGCLFVFLATRSEIFEAISAWVIAVGCFIAPIGASIEARRILRGLAAGDDARA